MSLYRVAASLGSKLSDNVLVFFGDPHVVIVFVEAGDIVVSMGY